MKEYARNHYHSSNGKIIAKNFFMKITKKSCKSKYEIIQKYFRRRRTKRRRRKK